MHVHMVKYWYSTGTGMGWDNRVSLSTSLAEGRSHVGQCTTGRDTCSVPEERKSEVGVLDFNEAMIALYAGGAGVRACERLVHHSVLSIRVSLVSCLSCLSSLSRGCVPVRPVWPCLLRLSLSQSGLVRRTGTVVPGTWCWASPLHPVGPGSN